jgi:multidrug transporter EmrE-like cation transporter
MRITTLNLTLVLCYSLIMAIGQIAFKFVAIDLRPPFSLAQAAVRLPFNVWFWAMAALYGVSMIYWIWLLSRVPVSIAYPISALSLGIVPLLSWMLYSEQLTIHYWLGLVFILIGITIITR